MTPEQKRELGDARQPKRKITEEEAYRQADLRLSARNRSLKNMKISTYTLAMGYDDLDQLITNFLQSKGYNEHFNKYGYDTVDKNKWENNQMYSFMIDGQVNDRDQKLIDAGAFGDLSTESIMNLMCKEGAIESGEYLITVNL